MPPQRPSRPTPILETATRGAALFLGALALFGVARALVAPELDAGHLWLDFRALPAAVRHLAFTALGGALGVRALARGRLAGRLGSAVRITLAAGALVALADTVTVLRLDLLGAIDAFPVPLSAGVAILLARLALVWPQAAAEPPPGALRARAGVLVAAAGAPLVFALAQIVCFGGTDYRRPADAIVVLGARAYADGRPSHALRDRVLTACELYRAGLAPRLVLSGGPGDGAYHETDVMRTLALRHGVPEGAIVLDRDGTSSRATVENVAGLLGERRVLVVSHGYHLPRLALAFEAVGVTAFTVPAPQRDPLLGTPWFVAREVAAWWAYFLRPPRHA